MDGPQCSVVVKSKGLGGQGCSSLTKQPDQCIVNKLGHLDQLDSLGDIYTSFPVFVYSNGHARILEENSNFP
jgi:hypothetical protein